MDSDKSPLRSKLDEAAIVMLNKAVEADDLAQIAKIFDSVAKYAEARDKLEPQTAKPEPKFDRLKKRLKRPPNSDGRDSAEAEAGEPGA